MDILLVGGLLLVIMMVLLSGGVWIAMTLAICGWVGQTFFTDTQPGKNLFSAFWESNASWELAALPLFIWMGEILYRYIEETTETCDDCGAKFYDGKWHDKPAVAQDQSKDVPF